MRHRFAATLPSRWLRLTRNGCNAWAKTAGVCLLPLVLPGICAAQQTQPQHPYKVRGIASGLLQLPPLTEPLKLEQPNRISLILYGGKVHSAFMTMSSVAGNDDSAIEYAAGPAAIRYDGSGHAYVEATPERLGRVRLRISVFFNDGSMDSENVDGDVVYPDRKPAGFDVVSDGSGYVGTIYLGLADPPDLQRAALFPRAFYAGAEHPVPIPHGDVKFTMISGTPNDPPISLDKATGEIRALHLGHALVLTTFQGFTVLTCIDVQQHSEDGNDRTDCRELVPDGMTPPPQVHYDRGLMPK